MKIWLITGFISSHSMKQLHCLPLRAQDHKSGEVVGGGWAGCRIDRLFWYIRRAPVVGVKGMFCIRQL